VVFLVCSIVLSLGLSLDGLSDFGFYEWSFLLLLGLNTLVAYGCFGAALKLAPASQVSVIITLNPVLTLLIIGFAGPYFEFIPNEGTSSLGYIGAGLVVTGVIFSTLSAKKLKKKV
jgi:drug/metabolite transporter (DMT)-like permease